jgi:hypothetical protein
MIRGRAGRVLDADLAARPGLGPDTASPVAAAALRAAGLGPARRAGVVRLTQARFGERAAGFERLTRMAAVSVNGMRVPRGRGCAGR